MSFGRLERRAGPQPLEPVGASRTADREAPLERDVGGLDAA